MTIHRETSLWGRLCEEIGVVWSAGADELALLQDSRTSGKTFALPGKILRFQ